MTYPFEHISWDSRTRRIAALIPEESAVVDLGAGKEHLRRHLRDPILYRPIDKHPLTRYTILADFNEGEFPDFPSVADYVVAQGIIEYIEDPLRFLREIKKYAPRLIISYRSEVGDPAERRHTNVTMEEFCHMLGLAGWSLEQQIAFSPTQYIFVCKK